MFNQIIVAELTTVAVFVLLHILFLILNQQNIMLPVIRKLKKKKKQKKKKVTGQISIFFLSSSWRAPELPQSAGLSDESQKLWYNGLTSVRHLATRKVKCFCLMELLSRPNDAFWCPSVKHATLGLFCLLFLNAVYISRSFRIVIG